MGSGGRPGGELLAGGQGGQAALGGGVINLVGCIQRVALMPRLQCQLCQPLECDSICMDTCSGT